MTDFHVELTAEEVDALRWLFASAAVTPTLANQDANRGGVLATLAARLALLWNQEHGGQFLTVDVVPVWALAALVGLRLDAQSPRAAAPKGAKAAPKAAAKVAVNPALRKRISEGVKKAAARRKAEKAALAAGNGEDRLALAQEGEGAGAIVDAALRDFDHGRQAHGGPGEVDAGGPDRA